MLEGDRIAPIAGAGTPGPDGLVDIPTQPDGKVTVTFSTPPTELTQVQVRPPTGTEPGDEVTVTVTYTDEDGNEEPRVSMMQPRQLLFVSQLGETDLVLH